MIVQTLISCKSSDWNELLTRLLPLTSPFSPLLLTPPAKVMLWSAQLVRFFPWQKPSWALQVLLRLSLTHLSSLSPIHRGWSALATPHSPQVSSTAHLWSFASLPFTLPRTHRPNCLSIFKVKLKIYPEASLDFPSPTTSVRVNCSLFYIDSPFPEPPVCSFPYHSVVLCLHPLSQPYSCSLEAHFSPWLLRVYL